MRVHASACALASLEHTSRMWDVASGQYRILYLIEKYHLSKLVENTV